MKNPFLFFSKWHGYILNIFRLVFILNSFFSVSETNIVDKAVFKIEGGLCGLIY